MRVRVELLFFSRADAYIKARIFALQRNAEEERREETHAHALTCGCSVNKQWCGKQCSQACRATSPGPMLLIGLLLACVPAEAERTIQVAIDELQPPGTSVRDLRTLVMPGAAMRFSFHLVQAAQFATKYFAIENTSVLVTKLEITKDALVNEQLCLADDCRLALQVNATGKRFVSDVLTAGRAKTTEDLMGEDVYQLLNLEITVNSVIKQPCKFDKTVTTQDVNELSDSQTFINLGNLNCPKQSQSVYLRLTLVDAAGNVVSQNRSAGFRLRYVLIKSRPQSLFRVDLVAPAGLDREVCEWHNFTVLATVADLETSARVFVHVDDADDNEPQFQHSSYALVVREDAPPGEIVRLEANDADSLPQNTEFEYTIIAVKCRHATRETDADCAKDTFGLDARTGALSLLNTLNYEHISRWTFVCGLRVYGTLVNSTTTVTVDVMNVNEPPHIAGCAPDGNSFAFSVPENLHEQRTICVVTARDEDGDSVKCDLSYDPFATQKFDVGRFFHLSLSKSKQTDDDAQWNLTTAAFPLDYEDERQHRVMVLCTDNPGDNSPQLTASTVVLITVENRNDPPKFSQPFFKLDLPENDERTVTSVTQAERSKKHKARYSLIIPNISFSVDPMFANLSDVHLAILPSAQDRAIDAAFQLRANDLYVNDAFVFDRESRQWYNFSLLARLTTEPSLASTVPVAIEIIDRNDNSPVFTTTDENMTVEVRIDTLVGRQVYCCVRATDRDAGTNGRVQYFIVSDIVELNRAKRLSIAALDARDYFTIDANSGELFLSKALNGSLAGQVIRLVVEARDQPLAVGDMRTASTVLRLHLIKPQQFYVGSRDYLSFSFGEFHNVVIIAMIVGVTVLVSGLLIGLIVCIKSKNSQRRAQHAAQLNASLNGRSMVKSGNLKVKLQTNGGYSRFRQASPNHYFNVTTYEPNIATDIDYPDSTLGAKQFNGNCAASLDVRHANAPLQYVAATQTKLAALPQQTAIESLDSSLANSPKGAMVMRSFTTEQAQQVNTSSLPPLNTDLDSAATDIDSGQGSSTSTSKATDLSSNNNRRSSTETSTVIDGSEMVTFDRSLPPPSHPLQAHDIYCTCSRRHGVNTLSRSSAPSPLPLVYRRNMQQTAVQDNCSPAVKSILRNTGQVQAVQGNQHYHTMLPKRHARNAHNTVSVAVQNGERRSLLTSSEV